LIDSQKTNSSPADNVRVSIFLAAFAAKQRRNVAFFASLRALRETKTGHYTPAQPFFNLFATTTCPQAGFCKGWCIFKAKIETMKQLFLLLVSTMTITVAAWSQAYEGSIEYDKKKQQAILIDYSFPPDAVQNAIVQKMGKLGYKPKEEKGLFNKDKGFLVFKNAYITDINGDRMDFVINVERKSRKASDQSVLYMIMYKDGGNALLAMKPDDINKAKSFLHNMLPEVEAADLELRIKDQEETISKAEKKLKTLKDDQASLEKRLSENKSDQEATQKDIETQKQALGVLIGKRKTN
jgi:hypothetical protein